jgi:hypothetical protein
MDLAWAMKKTVGELLDSFTEIDGIDEFYWWAAYRQVAPPDDPWTISAWNAMHTHLAAGNHKIKYKDCLPQFDVEKVKAAEKRKREHQAMMAALAQELREKRRKEQLDRVAQVAKR